MRENYVLPKIPLRQPIFDTERLPTEGVERIEFFSRCQGDRYAYFDDVKTKVDTNLVEKNSYKYEFSILGFYIIFDQYVTEIEKKSIIDSSLLVFTFNESELLQIPVAMIPREVLVGKNAKTAQGEYPYYPFHCGNNTAIKIRHKEKFGLDLIFREKLNLVTSAKITAVIHGLTWNSV